LLLLHKNYGRVNKIKTEGHSLEQYLRQSLQIKNLKTSSGKIETPDHALFLVVLILQEERGIKKISGIALLFTVL